MEVDPVELPFTPVPAAPVAPDDAVRALLDAQVGFRDGRLRETFGREGPWLLMAAVGSPPAPTAMADLVAAEFSFLGVVDYVRVLGAGRARLEVSISREMVLRRLLELSWVGPTVSRYVSVVADQYDQGGERVQRVAGTRVRLGRMDMPLRWGLSLEVAVAGRGWGWWATYPQRTAEA